MEGPRFVSVGGVAGLVFAGLWLVCAIGYLAQVGIPTSPPSLAEMVALMRRFEYRVLFWLWPLAFLALIPFALAAQVHLRRVSPVAARIGSAFCLLYAGVWFIFHAAIMASINLAQAEPIEEKSLALLLTLVGNLGSPLFWAIALFMGFWAVALIGSTGIERLAAAAFAIGSLSSVTYFVMRYTGPYRPAELMHELLILSMIVGIGTLSFAMIRAHSSSGDEHTHNIKHRVHAAGAV